MRKRQNSRAAFMILGAASLIGALTCFMLAVVAPRPMSLTTISALAQPQYQLDPQGAAVHLLQAAGAVTVKPPSASQIQIPLFPPFGTEWDNLASASFEANRTSLELSRRARSSNHAFWPGANDWTYLGQLRDLANVLADAAVYQHLTGNDADALETIRDLMHLSKMLSYNLGVGEVNRAVVAAGVDDVAMHRLKMIAPRMKLARQTSDLRTVSVEQFSQLIEKLYRDQTDADQTMKQIYGVHAPAVRNRDMKLYAEMFRRINAERTYAAMSLGCQIFRLDHQRWPASLDELVPKYLPGVPVDPWSGESETFGYILIKAGLPDGGDRPMVFSRCESDGKLVPPLDGPHYNFYVGDGSIPARSPRSSEFRNGQYRDVAAWPRP